MYDRNKWNYKFVFLFASPNFKEYSAGGSRTRIPFDRLEHEEEFRLLRESVIKSEMEINIHKVHGTLFNLQEAFSTTVEGESKVRGIHFSGHGVTKEYIEEELRSV